MEMNEKHEAALKALLATEILPETVVKFYSRIKKLADRRDILISDQVLLLIASVADSLPEKDELPPMSLENTSGYTSTETQNELKCNETETGNTGYEPTKKPPAPTPEPGIPCEVFFDGESRQGVFLEEQPEEVGEVRVRLLGTTEIIMVSENNVKLKE